MEYTQSNTVCIANASSGNRLWNQYRDNLNQTCVYVERDVKGKLLKVESGPQLHEGQDNWFLLLGGTQENLFGALQELRFFRCGAWGLWINVPNASES